MKFKRDQITRFKALFESHKDQIRSFKGCEHLELWQDQADETVFFTYSHWQSQEALDAYRHSALFAGVWKETKVGFDDKPAAWSTEQIALGSAM